MFAAYDPPTGSIKVTGTMTDSGGGATAANQETTNDRLGTPGTSEPAHAGGSTGVIGWLRDILAKISVQDNPAQYYTDTTTPLAANATFTGSTRTMAVGNNQFTAEVLSDVLTGNTATRLQASTDSGSTWGNTGPTPGNPAGNIPFVMEVNRRAGHYRVIHQNGATPQGSLRIISSQLP